MAGWHGGRRMGQATARADISFGMSWDHPKKRRLARAVLAFMVALSFLPWARAAPSAAGRLISVIVRELPGSGSTAERVVESLGGSVGRHLGIIHGFVATLPAGGLATVAALPGIHSVTPDSRIELMDIGSVSDLGYSMAPSTSRANAFWSQGYTGQGIDVALIDSGVVPVDGLRSSGAVVNGADLSFESQSPALQYMDTFGHGTHMAGIIAARQVSGGPGGLSTSVGMAPEARLVSLKVADAYGATDVSQVIAAIDWVVQHRNDNGMNIRVLNLAFGTDGVQDYQLDPLTYAAEVAWRNGIVVVVSAGNRGFGSPRLNNPAYDPYVIAVGAADDNTTSGTDDDSVPSFSSCGTEARHTDLVASGKSVLSMRDPGSMIDSEYRRARVGFRFYKGSGTSQAAAVVSGAAALLLDQRPELTPDEVKAILMGSATPINASENCQGAGMLNLPAARDFPTPAAVQTHAPATGLGSLDAARGTLHLEHNGVELQGEQDIFGAAWNAPQWAERCAAGTSWDGGTWNGNVWTDSSWSGMSWSGMSWGGMSWGGMSWSGMSWGGMSWGGMSWGGVSWGGMSWGGMSWGGMSWGGLAWGGMAWGGMAWGGASWE
jgi:serine protease AprX